MDKLSLYFVTKINKIYCVCKSINSKTLQLYTNLKKRKFCIYLGIETETMHVLYCRYIGRKIAVKIH